MKNLWLSCYGLICLMLVPGVRAQTATPAPSAAVTPTPTSVVAASPTPTPPTPTQAPSSTPSPTAAVVAGTPTSTPAPTSVVPTIGIVTPLVTPAPTTILVTPTFDPSPSATPGPTAIPTSQPTPTPTNQPSVLGIGGDDTLPPVLQQPVAKEVATVIATGPRVARQVIEQVALPSWNFLKNYKFNDFYKTEKIPAKESNALIVSGISLALTGWLMIKWEAIWGLIKSSRSSRVRTIPTTEDAFTA